MSRVKLLLDVVNDMRSLADSIQAVCDAIASDEPHEMPQAETPATAPEESTKKAEKTKPEKQPEITLEQVRGVLADKSRGDKTTNVVLDQTTNVFMNRTVNVTKTQTT